MTDGPIWILDEIEVAPGRGREFLDAYLTGYVPGAEARGATLVHRLVEPAMWLEDASNRLVFVWRLADVAAVWASKRASKADPSVGRWWREDVAPLVRSRRRSMLADADLVEALDV